MAIAEGQPETVKTCPRRGMAIVLRPPWKPLSETGLALGGEAVCKRPRCQIPNLRPDAEGEGLMEGKEPMHVSEVVVNETCKERFLLTPRDPQELEKFDSSMRDDTVENNTVVNIPRP